MTRAEWIAKNSDQVRKDYFCASIIDSLGWGMTDEQLEALYERLFKMYVNCWIDCSFERFPQAVYKFLEESNIDYLESDFSTVDGVCPVFDFIMALDAIEVTEEAIFLQLGSS